MASKFWSGAVALKCQGVDLNKINNWGVPTMKIPLSLHPNAKVNSSIFSIGHVVFCHSHGSPSTETEKYVKTSVDCMDSRGNATKSKEGIRGNYSRRGLSEACRFVYNDAKFVNERAQSDILLLSRSIRRINDRAIQDVAFLGMGLFKLDARARKDTEKIDHGVKKKAARINQIAMILKEKAHSDLKRAADKHWNDGALEADLRRADFIAKRRAMEDAFMALKFIRNIHEMMAGTVYQQFLVPVIGTVTDWFMNEPIHIGRPTKEGAFSVNDSLGFITLEKNGKSFDLLSRQVSSDRITAIQEAYWSMASALSEADGIDYTDPEELELLVATLIDLDAMDGKSTVSLLAECSSSPDVNTRKALANALAGAPSMWILGNAGMGALQRLANDSNPAVATAASKAINELKRQWELEEGDSLTFKMNQQLQVEDRDESD